MTGESNITKLNGLIGIVFGLTGLLTWITGLSTVPEIVFGKDAKEELKEQYFLPQDTTDIQREFIAIRNELVQLKQQQYTTDSNTNIVSVYSNDTINTCNLNGKTFTGAKVNEDIHFQTYNQTSYLVNIGLYLDDVKGVITQIADGRYKAVSGNFTGYITIADCKTVSGDITIADGPRKFTYYNIEKNKP
jgi:hypothetical protein